jgi:hypothetical protein
MIQNSGIMTEYQQLMQMKNMNRAEKRKLAKKMKIKYSDLVESLNFKIEDITVEELPEGTLVKLKADKILSKKEELSEQYIQWVESNRNKIFTCEKDPTLPKDSKRVVLKEDESNPKWIFHVTDLELVLDEKDVFASAFSLNNNDIEKNK